MIYLLQSRTQTPFRGRKSGAGEERRERPAFLDSISVFRLDRDVKNAFGFENTEEFPWRRTWKVGRDRFDRYHFLSRKVAHALTHVFDR